MTNFEFGQMVFNECYTGNLLQVCLIFMKKDKKISSAIRGLAAAAREVEEDRRSDVTKEFLREVDAILKQQVKQ